ncbi:MAG: LCP family protein [Anaerolineales bacterium]|nr:LCP family protein [Anaerolineales bacterium]
MDFFKEMRFGRLEWMILAAVFLGSLAAAAGLGVFRQPAAPLATGTPPPTGPVLATLPPTFTPPATPTAPPQAVAGQPATATPPAPLAPEPTATWFYAAPLTLDFAPTPVLPAAAPFPDSCDGPGRMNIVVAGLDGFSNDYARPARTDTVLLVGVNFAGKNAQILSLPRDLWVSLPNSLPVTEARLNSAYHYGEYYGVAGGGPAELKATLEAAFGLRIDRYAIVSFLAFEQAIDAIGGIEIDIPEPIHDPSYPRRSVPNDTIAIDFPAGRVQMDGGTALIYARIRHDSSDFQRMRRQQQVLFAIRDRLLRPETRPHLPALVQILYSSVRTDLTFEDIALLGCLGPQIERANIQARVVDAAMVEARTLADGAQVLVPKLDNLLPLLQAFNAGE